MATLGEFHSTVRDSLARGTALDSKIIAYTRQAARWMERNKAYKYMEKFGGIVLNSSATFPHVVDLPSPTVRNISMFRIVGSDGVYSKLKNISPRDQTALDTAKPVGYYQIGYTKLILDSKPDEDYICELLYNEFTPWPTDESATNWLLENAEDVLLAQTLYMLAAFQRDVKLMTIYKNLRDEGLHTLETVDGDLEGSNTDDSMVYE